MNTTKRKPLLAQLRPATAAAAIAAATTPELPAVVIPNRAAVRGLLIPGIDWAQNRLGPICNTRRLVKRNEKCPFCTSGKKFKHCHLRPTPRRELFTAAGHAQEDPLTFACTTTVPKGPRPAERKVIEE